MTLAQPDAANGILRRSSGLLLVDPTGSIVLASQSALDLLGHGRPEVTDRRLVSFIPSMHRERIARQIADVLTANSDECEAELPLVRKDRTGVNVRLQVIGVEARGGPIGALAMLDPVAPEQRDWPGPHVPITPRQRQVIGRLLDGVTVQEIADTLHISVNTARMHIKNMHATTQTRTLHGLAIWAMRHRDCCYLSD